MRTTLGNLMIFPVIAATLIVTWCTVPTAIAQSDSPKTESQLSPLPKVEDLEQAAKMVHVTVAKCEATASAFGSSATPELITSITDDRLHELNLLAFACMRLGGTGVRFGYTLKTVVDAAFAGNAITTALANQHRDTVKVASDMLEKVVSHNNELVNRYNELVEKYNSLLTKTKATVAYALQLQRTSDQMYAIAVQALNEAGYSRPSIVVPVTVERTAVYVQQSPLNCTAQRIGNFTYTNCF